MSTRQISFVVGEHETGVRLDRLLATHARIGRKQAKDLFAAGAVRIGARRPTAGETANPGDEVRCELADDAPEPEPTLALDVRFECPAFVVVEKPAAQPSAPLAPGERGTLVNALIARYPEMAGVGYRSREPGIVHRLDTQTSGLMLAARTSQAFETLKLALTSGSLSKRYLAVAADDGLPAEGSVEGAIGPDPHHPERVLVYRQAPAQSYARPAVTRFKVLQRRHGRLLIELEAPHAMRHQIRAHLASLGHPILGDVVYGSGQHPGLGARHALHASYIAWAGDGTLPSFEIRSELPAELAALLA